MMSEKKCHKGSHEAQSNLTDVTLTIAQTHTVTRFFISIKHVCYILPTETIQAFPPLICSSTKRNSNTYSTKQNKRNIIPLCALICEQQLARCYAVPGKWTGS